MKEGTSVKDYLDELNQIMMDLRNADVMIDEEHQDVKACLHNEVLREKVFRDTSGQADGLFAKGYSEKQSGDNSKSKSNSNSRSRKNDRCNYCKEKGHWKRNYPKLRDQQPSNSVGVVEEHSYSSSDVRYCQFVFQERRMCHGCWIQGARFI